MKEFVRVENNNGNEEIADNQRFLLFSQCLHKATFQGLLNTGLFGKGLRENDRTNM